MLRQVCTAALLAVALGGCGTVLDAIDGQDVGAQGRGAAYARAHCAACHALAQRGTSANAQAPTFAEIRERYAPRVLASELETSARVGHYGMPPQPTTTAERADLVAYITKGK
jgi:mono/diheme cytochrome c family protein